MSISAGYVDGKPVTVLRDTGCSDIVIRKCTVAEESFIVGKEQVSVLANVSKVTVPVAEVYIDSPYHKGRYEAVSLK